MTKKTSAKKKISWRNRIVGEGERAASEFMANPHNWRKHPPLQREVLSAILGEVGWVQRVIINRTTGRIIDGHARVEEALALGKKTPVPFVEVELSEAEERKILAVLDPIGSLAATDIEKFKELSKSFDFDQSTLTGLLENIRGQEVDLNDFFAEKEAAAAALSAGERFSINLEFETEAEYRSVLEGLQKIAPLPVDAVRKLLEL